MWLCVVAQGSRSKRGAGTSWKIWKKTQPRWYTFLSNLNYCTIKQPEIIPTISSDLLQSRVGSIPVTLDGKLWYPSVDGTAFQIDEPYPSSSLWYSQKFEGAGLRYEVAISLMEDSMFWAIGPFLWGDTLISKYFHIFWSKKFLVTNRLWATQRTVVRLSVPCAQSKTNISTFNQWCAPDTKLWMHASRTLTFCVPDSDVERNCMCTRFMQSSDLSSSCNALDNTPSSSTRK